MADLPVDAPNEATLIGAQTVSPFNGSGDWVVARPGHWLFAGTGLRRGTGSRGWSGGSSTATRPGSTGWRWWRRGRR